MKRAEKMLVARELKAAGHASAQIGAILGVSDSTIRNWTSGGVCADCGTPTEGSSAKKSKWCIPCSHNHLSELTSHWTRDRVILAIQAWAVEFGEPPAAPDWDGYRALKMNDPLRAARYRNYSRRGIVPSFMTVVYRFGSWNAAIEAAGFAGRCASGGCGNIMRQRRMRAKVAA